MQKYKLTAWLHGDPRGCIVPVEVDRESDSSVWIGGRRCAKLSGYESYFDTFEEARSRLLEQAEERVAGHRRDLEKAETFAEQVRNLREGI